jgi:hypothetical protein
MNNITSFDSIPEKLDVRLIRRDTSPLPSGALVKFQVISRDKDPRLNYRWVLYEDGRLFLAKHSNDTSGDYRNPFDSELPTTPTKTLSSAVVQEVRQRLTMANFEQQAPYQAIQGMKDGTFYVVTARQHQQEHEVIYDAVSNELTRFFRTIESK